jgi:hypothetical protein
MILLQLQGCIAVFAQGNRRQPQKSSVRITSFQTEIQNCDFPNMKQDILVKRNKLSFCTLVLIMMVLLFPPNMFTIGDFTQISSDFIHLICISSWLSIEWGYIHKTPNEEIYTHTYTHTHTLTFFLRSCISVSHSFLTVKQQEGKSESESSYICFYNNYNICLTNVSYLNWSQQQITTCRIVWFKTKTTTLKLKLDLLQHWFH